MEIEATLCTYEGVNQFKDYGFSSKCEFVRKYCQDDFSMIDNIDIYYCQFNESIILMLLYAIPYLAFCFYWLSSTADYYLEPAVSKVAKYLRFSESLAGITLIALANGMPDVIACYVASDYETEGGIQLSLGALYGASIFATTIILGRVLLNSDYLVLNRNALLRDLGFYIITNIYLLSIGSFGELNIYYALVLYGIYILFVVFALVEEVRIKTQQALNSPNDDLPKEMEFTHDNNQLDVERQLQPLGQYNHQLETPYTSKSNRMLSDKQSIAYPMEKSTSKNLCQAILSFVEIPFNFVRDITIPFMNSGPHAKYRIAGYPIFTTLFLLWRFGLLSDISLNAFWIILPICCISGSIVMYRIADKPEYYNILNFISVFLGFIVSVFWLHFIAELLIEFLNVIKIASGYSLNLIGLTILAWGNSSNDFFVDVALAKKGFGIMAVSGIFAGQFFNLNVGFGMVMVKKIWQDGFINLNFFDGQKVNTINYMLIVFSIASLTGTLVYSKLKHYYLSYKYAYFLFVFYCVFLICMYILSQFVKEILQTMISEYQNENTHMRDQMAILSY